MFIVSIIAGLLLIVAAASGFWTWDTKNNMMDRGVIVAIFAALVIQTVRLSYASIEINIDLGSEISPTGTVVADD